MAFATSPASAASSVRGLGQDLAGVLLGVVFTLGLFLGIARFDRATPSTVPADIMDLRAVVLQEPPPPRVVPQDQPPVDLLLSGIDIAPAHSPVQITVTPPDLRDLLPPQVAPPAVIQVGQLYANLKPKMDITTTSDHIFQMMEVDQVPRVLNRVTPKISPSVRGAAIMLRTSLIFVVEPTGEIKNVRIASTSGNAEFDAIILRTITDWSFSPAVRKGVKVRCLLQQAVIIKWTGGSGFEL
jgi:TonB family protein